MFGVLVDVSGSMESAYSLDGSQQSVNTERIQAVLTTTANIVNKEVRRHQRQESIFACAFGLSDTTKGETCDLLTLLDHISDTERINGHQKLIEMAHQRGYNKQRGYSELERWIPKHLSSFEAKILYKKLRDDKTGTLIDGLAAKMPHRLTMGAGMHYAKSHDKVRTFYTKFQHLVFHNIVTSDSVSKTSKEDEMVQDSEAYKYAKEIIAESLSNIYHLEPRQVQDVAKKLDSILKESSPSTSQSSSLNDTAKELIDPIKPYIFGGTPMCEAMNNAERLFRRSTADKKVLFILSDGMSADGDPRPIAQRLRDSGVTIATCFITSHSLHDNRRLLDPQDHRKFEERSGEKVLMQMSSSMKNTHTPVSYLIDANWELPISGESCLFVQANSLDVVNEFCRIVVSQLTNKTCELDALVHLVEKVPLATYINQTNVAFEPRTQQGQTCYACATATVFHLAMHRIVGREGGIPIFEEILKQITDEYGVEGASTEEVLKKVCPEYRLRYREVDEIGARKAVNERRPVVATFFVYEKQRDKLLTFYESTPKGILQKKDIEDDTRTNQAGHAVVLIRIDPNCLIFMNSSGKEFADRGFFRVKDQGVLNDTRFYDVYWEEKDLTLLEKKAYEKKCVQRIQDLVNTYPSVQDLMHFCPKCDKPSKVSDFFGHILEAVCPECYQRFVPTNAAMMESLYYKTFNS